MWRSIERHALQKNILIAQRDLSRLFLERYRTCEPG
jgi:hypothetical protein